MRNNKNCPTFFFLSAVAGAEKSDSSTMHRTIGIAVGCAAIYILLVIGLMIYCRARRARLLKGIIFLHKTIGVSVYYFH